MKTRMNFKDEFYQKLKLLVLPIAIQNFMLALVSATDAIMLGWLIRLRCLLFHWPDRCSLF